MHYIYIGTLVVLVDLMWSWMIKSVKKKNNNNKTSTMMSILKAYI